MLAASSGHAVFEQAVAGGVRNEVAGIIEQSWIDARLNQHLVRFLSEALKNGDSFQDASDAKCRGPRRSLACPIAHMRCGF